MSAPLASSTIEGSTAQVVRESLLVSAWCRAREVDAKKTLEAEASLQADLKQQAAMIENRHFLYGSVGKTKFRHGFCYFAK